MTSKLYLALSAILATAVIPAAYAADNDVTLRYKVTSASDIQGYFLKGSSDGSPDYGAGVSLKVSFR